MFQQPKNSINSLLLLTLVALLSMSCGSKSNSKDEENSMGDTSAKSGDSNPNGSSDNNGVVDPGEDGQNSPGNEQGSTSTDNQPGNTTDDTSVSTDMTGDTGTGEDTDPNTNSELDGGPGDNTGDTDTNTSSETDNTPADTDTGTGTDTDPETVPDDSECATSLGGVCRSVSFEEEGGPTVCQTGEVPLMNLAACRGIQVCCVPVQGACNGTCRDAQEVPVPGMEFNFPICATGESWDQTQSCPDEGQGCCVARPSCSEVSGTCRAIELNPTTPVELSPTIGCESGEGVDLEHSCAGAAEVCCVEGGGISIIDECDGTCQEDMSCPDGEIIDLMGSLSCTTITDASVPRVGVCCVVPDEEMLPSCAGTCRGGISCGNGESRDILGSIGCILRGGGGVQVCCVAS